MDADALLAELDGMSSGDLDAMLLAAPKRMPRPGERIQGTLVRIEEGAAFVDIGGKSEGFIDPIELDEDAAVGDRISAFVLRSGAGGVVLATQIRGTADRSVLEETYEAGLPVEGVVESKNSGGFVIKFGKTRAFCPVSQIDRIAGSDLDRFIGQRMNFRILDMDDRGIVVSHRVIAEEAIAEQAEKVWASISEGDIVDGIVVASKPFGSFVDVNGVRGLVPRSELGWGTTAPPNSGTTVKVRVMRVDHEAGKLTLSMKDPDAGPWSRVGLDFLEGGIYDGTVARIRDFGAFVTLAPGLDGLVPIRNLSDQRVDHPTDVLKEGQVVRVRLMRIDAGKERLELSVRHAVGHEADEVDHSPRSTRRSSGNASFGTFGDLLKNVKVRR
jgi:small subunit ribosomal protein S1